MLCFALIWRTFGVVVSELGLQTIAFAEAKRDLWMNTGGFALPSSFVTFGTNANNMALYGNCDSVLDRVSRDFQALRHPRVGHA